MKIIVMSHTKEQAERLWHFHMSHMFSGYEKPIFTNTLLRDLDGLDKSKLVIIFAGGYKPNNKQEAYAFAWYLDEGAMFIDFNKVNMESDKDRFKREYLGEFVKPVNQKRDIKKCDTCNGEAFIKYSEKGRLLACVVCNGNGYVEIKDEQPVYNYRAKDHKNAYDGQPMEREVIRGDNNAANN